MKKSNVTFGGWLREKNIILSDWQRDAAEVFLARVAKHKEAASGKTFLVNVLQEFVNTHGNNFFPSSDEK